MADLTGIERTGGGRVLADSGRLIISQGLQQLFATVRGLLLPNILGPLHYGTVAIIALVERYSTFSNLGIHEATIYQVPAKQAAGQHDEAEAINNTVFSFSLLMGFVSGLALLGWTWISWGRLSPELAGGLLLASLLPLLICYRGACMTWLRANGAFDVISRAGILVALTFLIFSIGLGWLWKTSGVVIGQLLALLLMLAYVTGRGHLRFSFTLKPASVLSLLRFGIPIHFFVGLPAIYLITADRLTIARVLGAEQVGYYAIGQMIASLLALVPGAAGLAMSTDLIALASRDPAGARHHLVKGTFAVAVLVAALSACLIAAIPTILLIAFPSYRAGAVTAQWLCVVAYFESLGMGAHYVVVSRGRIATYIGVYAGLALVTYSILAWASREWGILGVAVSMVPITAAKTSWLLWMGSRLAGSSARQCSLTISALLAIGVVATGIGWGAEWAVGLADDASRWAIAGITLARVALAAGSSVLVGILAGRWSGFPPTLVLAKVAQAVQSLRLSRA